MRLRKLCKYRTKFGLVDIAAEPEMAKRKNNSTFTGMLIQYHMFGRS